jgi:hypothetical protein
VAYVEGPGWATEQDGREAWRLSQALEKLLRARQPRGYRPTPEEDRRFEALMDEQRQASARGDLDGFREALAAIGWHSLRAYERHEREQAEFQEQTVGNRGGSG